MDDEHNDAGDRGEIVVFWPAGASDEKRDAHHRAQRWAHVLSWQVKRLYESRQRAMERQDEVRKAGFYPDDARWPFFEMDAEAHFALVAARQLIRALRAFDGDDRLQPTGLTNAEIRDVRDALEHWDAPGGSQAAERLKDRGAAADSHKWTKGGPGLLGDLVSDLALSRWASRVYQELLLWDPYDGWPAGKEAPARD